MRLTANSISPLRPTGLHKGPTHIQVQEGNSIRTPLSSDFVLVDSVAIQVMSVLPEKPSVLVIISWVLFQMDGEVVSYVSSSGKLYTTLIDTPGGIVTEHSQPDGQFERSGLDSEQICKPSKQNGHKQ